jgi:hypothetical protein
MCAMLYRCNKHSRNIYFAKAFRTADGACPQIKLLLNCERSPTLRLSAHVAKWKPRSDIDLHGRVYFSLHLPICT